ncbi:putative chaperone [Escherichia coli]|uniref:Putative chaperone n=1 Tax=Escherichia coli TaxID=562 RepID=A0A377E698_ECOLX|nr:putative chaperone [Escherichia coli]
MRAKHWKHCSVSICYPGVVRSSAKVEAHATTPFWRTMAPLTRDAISAMWDELEEDSEE